MLNKKWKCSDCYLGWVWVALKYTMGGASPSWGNQGRLPGGSGTYFETWQLLTRKSGKGRGDWSKNIIGREISGYKKLLAYLKNGKESRYIDYNVFLDERLVILSKGKLKWIPGISCWLQKDSLELLAPTRLSTGHNQFYHSGCKRVALRRSSGSGLSSGWVGPFRNVGCPKEAH